jgi:uncharacterized protein DUF4410
MRVAFCGREQTDGGPMCNLEATSLSPRRLVVMIALLLAGCATVKVTGQRALGAVPTAPPSVIYVSDFTFSAEGVSAERGILPISLVNEAASESSIVFSRIFGVQINRGVRERELANLMATSLIEDLRNLGVTAYRFGPRDQLPAGSWLVQGTFVQVDEGNRLERALIGFGQGATELDVVASLSDLRGDHPRPFCEVSTIAHSRRQAGAIMSLNPFDAVGRFMRGGLDLDKNVMETGSKLATTIAHRVESRDCALDS